MTAKESLLVSGDWLEANLADPAIRVLEVCSVPDDTAFRAGHIPGAQWVYWKSACWHETDREFITPEAMASLLGGMGIGADTTLVLYGDPVQHGTYALWAYTMAGHRRLKLLDGSRKRWIAEGRPLTPQITRHASVAYAVPAPDATSRVGRRNVRDALKRPDRLLLDVRAPEEYRGERVIDHSFPFDHGAERTGRIPGAAHLYFRDLLNDDDTFKPVEEMRARIAAAGLVPGRFADIVCYCRLSHRATLVWFALTHILGLDSVKIYDGSWTEWGSIVGYPIER